MSKKQHLYRVAFMNRGKIYELHAREVGQADLYGFVEIGGFEFGDAGSVVIDPSEERLRSEFEGVKSTYVPMHAILRIDTVEKSGTNKISALGENDKIAHFPSPIYTPGGAKKD